MKIPLKLQKEELGFVKIPAKEKGPKELKWQLNPHQWQEAEKWLENGLNYGVMGGYGGLIIIDADAQVIADLIESSLPQTFTVQTGSGKRHYYFFCPEIKNKIVFNDKLEPSQFLENETHYGEIISYGSQAVGPGSIHPNTGKEYQVFNDIEIASITQEQIFSVFDRFLSSNFFAKKDYKKIDEDKNMPVELNILDILSKFGIPTEYRGRQLQISHPVHGSEGGLNFAVNPEKNAWFCFRHNSGGGPMSLIAVLEGIIDCSEAVSGGLRGGRFLAVKDIAIEKYGLKTDLKRTADNIAKINSQEEIYAQLKKDFFYTDEKTGRKKVSPFGIQSIATYFTANYHVKTLGDYRNREIYLYKNGKYDEQGANFFHAEIEKILGESCNIHYQSEIIDKIKNLTFMEREKFKAPEEYMNFTNGIYNFKTNELMPHDPKYYFMHQLPVSYNPEADCPEIKKFIVEIFKPEDIPVIQEWIGYLLYRRYFIKKALILFGVGNSGKTTFINILTKFYGQENIAGVSLQKIGGDKFAAASLYDKHVNLYDDLSSNDIAENGMFKIVTGGGYVPAEHKYGDQFSFLNYAKLVFACNKIPSPKDTDDDAYFDRWVLINLTKTIPIDKRDPYLYDKLTAETELSGLLNFGLEGLSRIMNDGHGRFSYSKETYEVKTEMLKSNSSIAQFAFECLEKENGAGISKDALYEAYGTFCADNELSVDTKDKFGKSLLKYVGYAIEGWIFDTIIQKRGRGWRNVKIKVFEDTAVNNQV